MKRLFPLLRSIPSYGLSFVSWWFRELGELFPNLKIFADGRTVAFLRLALDHSEIILRDRHGKEIDRIEFGNDMLTRSGGECASIHEQLTGMSIELSMMPNDVCLLEWQHLGKQRPTREAVRYRLLQESPIDAASMEFDWRTKSEGAKSGEAPVVEVALCRKVALAHAIEQAKNLGLAPIAVGFASPQSASLNWVFKRPARSMAFSLGAYKKTLLLAGLVAWPILAMLAVGAVAALESRAVRSGLDEQYKSLRTSESLLHRQAGLSGAYGVLRQAMSAPSYTAAINELGGLLPSDAWFSELKVEGGSLRIVGFGVDPTTAAKVLSSARQVRDIRLGSVSSPNPGVPTTQFELIASVGSHL